MKLLLAGLATVFSLTAFSQKLDARQERLMLWAEDTLQRYSTAMIFDPEPEMRLKADSQFTRLLVRTLRRPYSFYFPFDSVQTVSKLAPPDSSFRILTWQVQLSPNQYRQKGAIQINTPDGSLKLFPLNDVSEFDEKPYEGVRRPNDWIGAIYYNIIPTEANGQRYYTLLGYDDYSSEVTRKWIEVLRFDKEGKPEFGGSFRYRPEPTKAPMPAARFLLEFKKDGRCRMNFDKELQAISFEHLVSTENQPENHATLLPDGDYEGFSWRDGVWVHMLDLPVAKQKIAVSDMLMGNAPAEASVRGADGSFDDAKLDARSLDNYERYEKLRLEQEKKHAEAAKDRVRRKGKQPTSSEY